MSRNSDLSADVFGGDAWSTQMDEECGVLEVRSPLTVTQLAGHGSSVQTIIFGSDLTERDYRLVGDWLREHPSVTVSVSDFEEYNLITNLDFLRWLPGLRRFRVNAFGLQDIGGLRYLPDDVEALSLGRTTKRLSMSGLSRFTELRRLYLEGHTKDIEVLARLVLQPHLWWSASGCVVAASGAGLVSAAPV